MNHGIFHNYMELCYKTFEFIRRNQLVGHNLNGILAASPDLARFEFTYPES